MSPWSVATYTSRAPLSRARSATRTTIGLPPISASAFPGSRLDAKRAGMMAVKDVRWILGGRLLVHSPTSSSGGSFLASSSSITGISSRIGNASRSALQTNSACALRYTSGPLQIGQTRMSSSRESMNSFQYEFRQGRVEFGLDSHRNQISPAEVAAFYRILFGQQHEIAIGELEVFGPKRVVIRKRVSRELEPHARKPVEKPLGIADSGDRVQFLSGKLRLRQRRPVPIDPVQTGRREPHAKCAGLRLGAVHDGRIHAATGRLAQRTGRKEQAVAKTALILDCDLEISLQAVMLQSIVAENHVAARVGCEQRTRGGGAICADPHRAPRTLCKQQRLVADLRGIITLAHRVGSGVVPAVASAENSGVQPLRAQGVDEREDQRGFPRASDR